MGRPERNHGQHVDRAQPPLSALEGAVWPDKSGAMLLPLVASSMSAFGGKADVNRIHPICPLIATSGHWRWVKSNRDLAYRDSGGGRHWSVAQEGYKQMRKAFGVTAEG